MRDGQGSSVRRSLLASTTGATSVEYLALVAVVALASIASIGGLGAAVLGDGFARGSVSADAERFDATRSASTASFATSSAAALTADDGRPRTVVGTTPAARGLDAARRPSGAAIGGARLDPARSSTGETRTGDRAAPSGEAAGTTEARPAEELHRSGTALGPTSVGSSPRDAGLTPAGGSGTSIATAEADRDDARDGDAGDDDCGWFSTCRLGRIAGGVRDFAMGVASGAGHALGSTVRMIDGAVRFAGRLATFDGDAWGSVAHGIGRLFSDPVGVARDAWGLAKDTARAYADMAGACIEFDAYACGEAVGEIGFDVLVGSKVGVVAAAGRRAAQTDLTTFDRAPLLEPVRDERTPAEERLSPVAWRILQAIEAADADQSLIPADQALTFGNTAEPALVTGGEIFPRLADAIAGAEREVDIAMFVFDPASEPGQELLESLRRLEARRRAEGATEPVDVRILAWSHELKAGDNGAKMYRAIAELGLDPRYVRVDVATRTSWAFGAMHQKLAIVDGETIHIGGANVQTQHDWTDNVPWHDTAYVLHGAVGQSMLTTFDTEWDESRTWRCDASRCASADNPRPLRPARPRAAPADTGGIPMIALTRDADGGLLQRGTAHRNPASQGYLAAMAAAERVIKIHTPNLNDDAALAGIRDALRRGVEVRIVTSRGFNQMTERLPGIGGDNEHNVRELERWARRELGREEAERLLQVRWYSPDGRGAFDGNGPGASHTKYMSVDGQVAIVGSSNMDTQSWKHSAEVNVAIDDARTTAAWDARVFDPSFARGEDR